MALYVPLPVPACCGKGMVGAILLCLAAWVVLGFYPESASCQLNTLVSQGSERMRLAEPGVYATRKGYERAYARESRKGGVVYDYEAHRMGKSATAAKVAALERTEEVAKREQWILQREISSEKWDSGEEMFLHIMAGAFPGGNPSLRRAEGWWDSLARAPKRVLYQLAVPEEELARIRFNKNQALCTEVIDFWASHPAFTLVVPSVDNALFAQDPRVLTKFMQLVQRLGQACHDQNGATIFFQLHSHHYCSQLYELNSGSHVRNLAGKPVPSKGEWMHPPKPKDLQSVWEVHAKHEGLNPTVVGSPIVLHVVRNHCTSPGEVMQLVALVGDAWHDDSYGKQTETLEGHATWLLGAIGCPTRGTLGGQSKELSAAIQAGRPQKALEAPQEGSGQDVRG